MESRGSVTEETQSVELILQQSLFLTAFNVAAAKLMRFLVHTNSILIFIFEELDTLDRNLMKMSNLYGFICQLFFFSLCDMVMLRPYVKELMPAKAITGPTTLLFYTVFTYFVSKVRDIVTNNFSIHSSYSRLDLVRWVFKILLEWAKAIVIVICLKEQGIVYKPKTLYTIVTFIYYICTEKLFLELIPEIVRYFNFDIFDSMEHLYVPIVMYIYSIFVGFVVISLMLTKRLSWYTLFGTYFILYMRLKDLLYNYVTVLLLEIETFQSFKIATNKEIQEWDDICAVCLNRMSRARITPCNHLFHPQCLRMCLQNSFKCPLCKKDFLR
ncbi:ERAD-associated E3 ubiquitin-protein ligase HRD1-like [Agrilus planipennis]|uniref:ERAD-associated E3 ubiquitin-protein ligase HRD1-like n=1 Tax=Agrilus planipennis TaxID=224129 RepID=A0A1W4WYM0_AGRPL|nr:ERAD-associated E3 ubiquitin-protein ligase HRD1-like [Agrilus planipennis]